jgi:predicted restriction endonuclease
MVIEIKSLYDHYMICKTKHFEKENGSVYSEVAHIVPFHVDQDDKSNNLMSLCPTYHKKFDLAKTSEKINIYKKLCENYSKIDFRHPLFLEEKQ